MTYRELMIQLLLKVLEDKFDKEVDTHLTYGYPGVVTVTGVDKDGRILLMQY